MPVRSNTKMSCIVMTSPSMPVISEMPVTLRVPSDMRDDLDDQVDRRRDLLADRRAPGCSGWPSPPSCRGDTARRAGCWRGSVVRLPSWPVFIACSMSSASSPRTSPTMMRSGRIRRALTTSSRCADRALAFDVRRPRLQPDDVALPQHQFGRVLDRDDALVVGDEARQHVQQRRLAGAGAARHDDVQAAGDRGLQEVEHRLRSRLARRPDRARRAGRSGTGESTAPARRARAAG